MKLTKFWAPWCGPCKMLGKIVDKIKLKHPELVVEEINVDKSPDEATRACVVSIPHMIFERDDGTVYTHTGIMTEGDIKEKLGL